MAWRSVDPFSIVQRSVGVSPRAGSFVTPRRSSTRTALRCSMAKAARSCSGTAPTTSQRRSQRPTSRAFSRSTIPRDRAPGSAMRRSKDALPRRSTANVRSPPSQRKRARPRSDESNSGRHGDMTSGYGHTPFSRFAACPDRSPRLRRTRRSGPDRARRHRRARRRARPSRFAACRWPCARGQPRG